MATQTRYFPVKTTVVRYEDDAGGHLGCGKSKHLYVGRYGSSGSRNYRVYAKATPDWVGMGKIVSATLCVYTDDFAGIMPQPKSTDTPKVILRRVTSTPFFGDNADGTWNSTDWTSESYTTSDQVVKNMVKTPNGLTRIGMTEIVEDWAPSGVQRHDGGGGGHDTHYAFGLFGYTDADYNWSGWSEDQGTSAYDPVIEVVYELGPTVPNTPTALSPAGLVPALVAFGANFSDPRSTDKLAYSEVEVYTSVVTNSGQDITLNGGSKLWSRKAAASDTEALTGVSFVEPTGLVLHRRTNYKWRIRHYDNEGKVSPWTGLVTFSIDNHDPNAPVLTPASGSIVGTLKAVPFSGTFSDTDGDQLAAYQAQLSTLSAGDPLWNDTDFLLWDTGKVIVTPGLPAWSTFYGGDPLAAGVYTLRARNWDTYDGVSPWAYSTIQVTQPFDPEPGAADVAQYDPIAPWRIVIRDMGTNRGPGKTVAILENAKKTGASKMYNSPGELHFTLPVDHPQISVIEPKQTHYSLQLYLGDGWVEKYAGLIWDFDATETDVVFYGIDYLGLFDLVKDERYDPANPDRAYNNVTGFPGGGSKYVDKTIRTIVVNQLQRAVGLPNSPVGFITLGTIATMNEKVTIWSTMEPTLSFVAGLLDSHRQGTGKKTRIRVSRDTAGAYKVIVDDDPGIQRDALRMKYGELVQGYRVVPFGDSWSSVTHVIGRTREGLKVYYKSASAPGVDQAVWGRIANVQTMDNIADENDVLRRTKQAALTAGKLGRKIGIGLRSGVLKPFHGYDICDSVPVAINHGAVDTDAFGSGYWTIYGVAWETEDNGSTNTILTLLPREDTSPADDSLIPSRPILSNNQEWQIGWHAPDPLTVTARYWLDQSTGTVYSRVTGAVVAVGVTATP